MKPVRQIILNENIQLDILEDKIIEEGLLMFRSKLPDDRIKDQFLLELMIESLENSLKDSYKNLFLICLEFWLKRNHPNLWDLFHYKVQYQPQEPLDLSYFSSLIKDSYDLIKYQIYGDTGRIFTVENFSKKLKKELVEDVKRNGIITDTSGCDENNIFSLIPLSINLFYEGEIVVLYDIKKKPKSRRFFEDLDSEYFL